MKIFCFFLYLCVLLSRARCDLPIHALMGDVYGTWKISQTKILSDSPQNCGGGIPNRNEDNLNEKLKNYESYLNKNYGEMEDLRIELTIEKTKVINEWKPRDSWTYLAVRDAVTHDIIGQWTMVYDEGFEIRIKGRRYFSLFKYKRNNSEHCPQLLSSFVSNNNKRCYTTDPTKIQLGWFVDEKTNVVLKEKVFHWGCFSAEKEENVNTLSYVIHNPNYRMNVEDINNIGDIPQVVNNKFSPFNKRANYEKLWILKPLTDFGSTKTNLRNIHDREGTNYYACKKNDNGNMKIKLNLPKSFTWGDPYTNEDFDEDVEDQKECGSCYAIASTFSLQKRFEILFLKRYKTEVTVPKLSFQSLLNCSPFNQGCDGGYPFLIGRHMYEFGITTNSCMRHTFDMSDDEECKIDMGGFNKHRNNDNEERKSTHKAKPQYCDEIYYASDYNYIGGCYECCNEYDMMNEILLNGPIVVAINVKPDLLQLYKVDKDIIYTKVSQENKICDILNAGFNGWQYTNHAVNIIGWGEQLDKNNKALKYWVIRNTWGKEWGYKGYLKIQRGINLGGIESQAVYIDPDFTRGHPLNFLKNKQ